MGGDSDYDDDNEVEGPKSTFGIYLAEGDNLYKQGEYKKALDSYTLALELQPDDKTCLVARSKCYLKLGDPQAALQDAEASLVEDKKYNKGLYQKAEALYSMGDFEYALMYYHRGHKLRPELDEFRLGIQKAQEAIDNSIGTAANIKLENKGDLSFFTKPDDSGKKKAGAAGGGYIKPGAKPKPINRNKETKAPAPSKKAVKQLLGELYADKDYLEKLMKDDGFVKDHSNAPIVELVESGLNYLKTRTEFWRQQKPLYARKKESDVPSKAPAKSKDKKDSLKKKRAAVGKFIVKQLEEIDETLANGQPDHSLKVAQQTLRSVEGMADAECPNKKEIVANLYSCIGNAYIEMDQLDKALKSHQKDLDVCKRNKLEDGKSRALDNVGRVYARMGKYEKAVSSWTEKIPRLKTATESTWLFHEIGRCHLELQNFTEAKEYGEKSLAAGEEADDQVWMLNASVLIAQAQVKLNSLEPAVKSFENALTFAVSLGDDAAQSAISKALGDLKSKIEATPDAAPASSEPESSPASPASSAPEPEKTASPPASDPEPSTASDEPPDTTAADSTADDTAAATSEGDA